MKPWTSSTRQYPRWRKRLRRPIQLLSCCSLFLALHIHAPARATEASDFEYQVKAAFLPKFALFVEWPEDAFAATNSPIVVGILGDDPFGSQFEQNLKNQNANGRHFTVRHFGQLSEIDACHILFVAPSERKSLPAILQALKHSFTVTVGDVEEFAEQGGIIEFIKADGRVRFEINLEAAERQKLKISAKLLQVSRVVGRKL